MEVYPRKHGTLLGVLLLGKKKTRERERERERKRKRKQVGLAGLNKRRSI
jgi:hypothetical protein